MLFIMMTGLVGMSMATNAPEPGPKTTPDRGANALYLLLGFEQREVGLDRLLETLPEAVREGYSLSELQRAAGRLGLETEGVVDSKRAGVWDRPAIAHVQSPGEPGHYMVVRPVGQSGTKVQVIDPPFVPRIVDRDRLREMPQWTGHLLRRRDPWIVRHRNSALGALLAIACLIFPSYRWMMSARDAEGSPASEPDSFAESGSEDRLSAGTR